MTAYYVRSGAAGTGDGSSWANAFTTLAAALSGKAAGSTYYVSEDHAETQASTLQLTFNGTITSPDIVICVNHSGTVPPVSADRRATATITTTGTSNLTLGPGFAIIDGVIFQAGTGSSTVNLNVMSTVTTSGGFKLLNCSLQLLNTAAASRISFGGTTSSVNYGYNENVNTTVKFSSTSQAILFSQGTTYFRNTPSFVQGATIPTNLVTGITIPCAMAVFEGVDLSALGSGKNLINASTGGPRVLFVNCKLGASVTPAATPTSPAAVVDLVNSDSSATTNRQERYTAMGTLTTENTIVRSGGANDSVASNSWKIVTTANASKAVPFETFPIDLWNSKVGQTVNVNVELINDGTTLQNSDVWVDAYYLGDAGDPMATLISSAPADLLAAAANITTSSVTWVTTGITTPIKQVITLSFTPQTQGYVRLYVRIAKVSKTIWVDPAAYFN